MSKKVGDYYHLSGAIHVHTTASDGTKSFDEVVTIGLQAGLDFILFADHMGLGHRENGKEGVYDNLVALIGYEHNDPDDNNHFLIFESPKVYPGTMTAAEYVTAAANDSALGIVAHPDEIRSREGRYPPYPWLDWSVDRFDGLELWNQMSEWMEKLTFWNQLALALSPRKSMTGPTARVLKIFDEINQRRKAVGICSVDAHAFPIKVGPMTIEIFPYKVHFKSIRSHLILPERLSQDISVARKQIYDAIRDCRVFGSNMRWGNAETFRFMASNSTEQAIIGGTVSTVAGTRLNVELPSRAKIRLVANGVEAVSTITDNLEYAVQAPGVYRVEAWKGNSGWIFSNHIRVGC